MATFLPATEPSQPVQLDDSPEQADEPDCDAVFTEYIVFEIGIISCIYLILAGTIIINRFKFSHVALVSTPGYPISLRIKTIAQIFMMGLLVASLGLSFLDTSYWVKSCNNPLFGLLYLIHIAVLVLNIDWMKFQFERKIPLLWYQNQLFWGLLSVFYMFALILCYFINSSGRYGAPDFYIVILKVMNAIFMTAYTIRKRQDVADFMGDSGLKSRLIQKQKQLETQKRRIAQDEKDSAKKKIGLNNQRNSMDEKKPELKVTVINKIQRREDEQTGRIEVLYKLHVIIGPCDYKISHNLTDFRTLSTSLLAEEPQNEAYIAASDNLNATLSDPDIENMSNFTFVVLNLQNFFNTILKSSKISDSLITFLKVPEEGVQHLQPPAKEKKRDTVDVPEEINSVKNPLVFIKVDDNEEEEKKESQEGIKLSRRETLEIKKANEQDYFPYFVVSVPSYRKAAKGDYIEFMINLQLIEKLDEGWQVFKRYSDFVHMKQQLKDLLNVVPPKLPTKFVVTSDDDQMEERRKGLENWLRIVLNEKLYFTPQLFEFVKLNPSYYEWLQEEETIDFSHFKAKIDKNHILINNSKPYTVYHIIIEEKREGDSRLKKRVYTLYRRFKEFYELQEALQTRFAKSVKLPELPPKYTAFSNKTTTDFRQQGLETYLNQLFGYPNIGDSFAFRKFINFRRVVDSFITGKESTEHVIASSYEPEVQNISNETIDKMLSTARNKKNQE